MESATFLTSPKHRLRLAGFIRVRQMSGKFKFFQGQGILCCVSEKWIFAKMSGNFIISILYQMMRNRKLLGQFS